MVVLLSVKAHTRCRCRLRHLPAQDNTAALQTRRRLSCLMAIASMVAMCQAPTAMPSKAQLPRAERAANRWAREPMVLARHSDLLTAPQHGYHLTD